MNKALRIIVILVISYLPMTLSAAGTNQDLNVRNYFQFMIPKYATTRQSGQTVTIYVRYAYKKNLPSNEYLDYRILRTKILSYMEPSKELPAEVYWEIIATEMGDRLMKDYPLDGVSIQLTVMDNQNPNNYEPGNHGPVYTVGHIAPLDVPLSLM